MRKFAFVILNDSDVIVDRFNLDYVDGLSGLGFSMKLSKIESDIEDYITKIVQQKKTIGLTVHHVSGYKAGGYLRLWLSKHIEDCLCLEYDNGETVSFIEGIVSECSQTELNSYGNLEQKITFQPITPFFEKYDNDVRIQISTIGKSYPFKYPYMYGKNQILNNEINNSYIKEIPIIATIYGEISNPTIKLLDENGEIYNEIRFLDVDLQDGQRIIINSAQKKIRFDDGSGKLVDYYYKIDGAYDSYLRAKALTLSKLSIDLSPSQNGYLTASRRQYKL